MPDAISSFGELWWSSLIKINSVFDADRACDLSVRGQFTAEMNVAGGPGNYETGDVEND